MNKKLRYRLITGPVDASFFEKRISSHLDEGYELYGSPSVTYDGKDVIAAQAITLKETEKHKKNKKNNT